MSDAEMTESDSRDDLSSLDLDESDDKEHFMPPSERLLNRHSNEDQRQDDAYEYLNLKHIPTSLLEDTSDEESVVPDFKRPHLFTNKYHSIVFPGKNIPVTKYRKSKETRNPYQGVVEVCKEELVPTLSVECPLPGGEAVTMVTDPVERASWGPLTRIEATKEARDVVKDWSIASATAGMKHSKKHNKNKTKVTLVSKTEAVDKTKDGEDAGHTTSQAETDVTNLRARYLSPPPPTPPDAIFHARLSMPTVPELHRSSDPIIVEQYRLQRAQDPETFDKETRSIKRGLIQDKVTRGGSNFLLKNEYTVELACREDAVLAARWASGRIASTRSRSNTASTTAAKIPDKTGMRGGEMEDPSSVAKVIQGAKDKLASIAGMQNKEAEMEEEKENASKKEPTDAAETDKEKLKNGKSVDHTSANMKAARDDLKAKLKSFDLPSHVSKVITSGMVRHQHSERREITHLGEKRIVTTWIQIEEVYEVPASETLTWKDVVTAVEQGEYEDDGGQGKESKKGRKHKTRKAQRHSRSAVSGKQRKTTDDSSDSDDSVQSSTSDGQTRTESLLDALSRSDKLSEQGISALAQDLKRVLATLKGNGELNVEEEE